MTSGDQFNLITGPGPGGGPQVVVIDGAQVAQTDSEGRIASSAVLDSFYVMPSSFSGGVRVGFNGSVNNGKPAILTGVGPTGSPEVASFDASTFDALSTFFALPQGYTGGLLVGG